MSEYTVGILFQKRYTEQVQAYMRHVPMPHIIQPLNASWDVLYLEDDWLHEPSTLEMIKSLSEIAPLLRFIHPADSGWGYQIYYNGEEVASLYDSKELAITMAEEWGRQHFSPPAGFQEIYYPSFDPRWNDLVEEMGKSAEYPVRVRAQFTQCNVFHFRLFDIGQDTIDKLEQLFLPDNVEASRNGILHRRSDFKIALDIDEMYWTSYKSSLYFQEKSGKELQ